MRSNAPESHADSLITKDYVDTATGLLVPKSYLDTDGLLAENSDTKLATQKAIKSYVDRLLPLEKVNDATLGSDTASHSVNLTGGYSFYLAIIRARGTVLNANVIVRATFNNDSGNNYSSNGSSLIGYMALGIVSGSLTNTTRWGYFVYFISVGVSSYTTMNGMSGAYVSSNATASTSASTVPNSWKGSETSTLSSIQFFCQSGNLASGSRIYIAGIL